jgi:hypothetical protein
MDQSEVRRSKEEPVGLHVMTYVYGFQVDAVERDAFEVLRLAGYMKNKFAPANRVPREVLSTIPDYCPEKRLDQTIIRLSHVCRRWRDTFTSRPSLWTYFSFKNIDKTRTYIQRSKSSPITLNIDVYIIYPRRIRDTFPLIIPHIHRLKSLTISGAGALPGIIKHFHCHTPLLEHLDISSGGVLDGAPFGGDLSSLRKLRLNHVTTRFPWKNLANLRVVELGDSSYGVTQILDFFESAPFLHTISLGHPELPSSDAPLERIVTLLHLKVFTISTRADPLVLLHHLHIPTGSSLRVELISDGKYEKSPLLDYLSRRSTNFSNFSDATTINLHYDGTRTSIRLSGPSGSLRLIVSRCGLAHYGVERQSFRFLVPIIPTARRLTISGREKNEGPAEIEDCPIFQTLSSANNLRTLTLINCNNQLSTRALDPEQNPSNLVLCPDMEELAIYLQHSDRLDFDRLVSMAKNRASKGARLLSVTFVHAKSVGEIYDLSTLQEHVTHIKGSISHEPDWDWIPGEGVSTED